MQRERGWRRRLLFEGFVRSFGVLRLLSEADLFVGAVDSQHSRLAYQLMAMLEGLHPSFSSVHQPWSASLTYPRLGWWLESGHKRYTL